MQSYINGIFFLFLLSLSSVPSPTSAHNITRILSHFPELSTFNHYLTITHLADEINRRQTITVCAVDNAAMNDLLTQHHPAISTLKHILSLHVLLDYFDHKKLHQISGGAALAATLYQATGDAPGAAGFVNITDLKGGKVGFNAKDNSGPISATFVKSIKEIPYNLSVIQISHILTSPDAHAPAEAPEDANLTAIMSAHGCKFFADALTSNSDALKTFMDNVEGGLTVFCPMDDAFKNFMPKFKNLTADGKNSLLLYHGVPIYESMAMLKSNNGLMNTLATDGAKKFDFTVQNDGEDVTLKTKIVTAKITGTLIDEQPLAIHSVDKVLLPKELFKADIAPAPAPASQTKKKHHHASPPAPPSDSTVESPADSPADGPAADEGEADDRNDGGRREKGFWRLALSVGLGAVWIAVVNV
ncbi:hypothetical protein Cgig2_008831 [Carnegiea gigantea]|uniref:FAS1 domain-containing protein n=1 Tax=Carnegiea gigantea TaxID=171969 RepID=A0A9Q1Q5Z4_9CARY|nr:hypothetical protein Cgig2_008831 [Carnegiea gigantea]